MGDTKRGRERKGLKKREQRIEHELERELDASDEPPEAPETPDVSEDDVPYET
jgi:hypothetical protein